MLKKCVIIVVLLIIILLTYLFCSFIYFKSNIENDKKLLKKQYIIFSENYFYSQPKEASDFNVMFKWFNKNLTEKYKVINTKNLNVNYDSISKVSNIYYFNKKTNKTTNRLNFFKFIFNKPFSIHINTIFLDSFDCDRLSGSKSLPKYALLSNFDLFKEEENLLGIESNKNEFYKQLNNFEKIINNKIPEPRELNVLWFVYKKGKIKIICRDNFSIDSTNDITMNLENYFEKIDTDYFDYSLFALRLFNPHLDI